LNDYHNNIKNLCNYHNLPKNPSKQPLQTPFQQKIIIRIEVTERIIMKVIEKPEKIKFERERIRKIKIKGNSKRK
jgi:hypothetical protein